MGPWGHPGQLRRHGQAGPWLGSRAGADRRPGAVSARVPGRQQPGDRSRWIQGWTPPDIRASELRQSPINTFTRDASPAAYFHLTTGQFAICCFLRIRRRSRCRPCIAAILRPRRRPCIAAIGHATVMKRITRITNAKFIRVVYLISFIMSILEAFCK